MVDVFKDILPSILVTKENVLDNEKDYNPYVVNKALSFHYDCILHSNQMNMYPNISGSLQYHYYLNTLRAWKRPFQKWQKKLITDDRLETVKESLDYSDEKAKSALEVLTDEQIIMMKKTLDKGGINDGRIPRTRSSN